jgi:hypothetical protein
MWKSKNITSFFAAERKASKKFGTHKLHVSFEFTPIDPVVHNNLEIMNFTTITENNIKKKIEELRNLEEHLNNQQKLFEDRMTEFKNQVELCKHLVVCPPEVAIIENLPYYKKTSGIPEFETGDTGDILIIDEKPIRVEDCVRIMWATMICAENGDYESIRKLLKSVKANTSYQYHIMIMSKTQIAIRNLKTNKQTSL